MNQIKTFEDACKATGRNPETVTAAFAQLEEKLGKPLFNHAKMVIIAEALNEGWQPDWNNWDEDKWQPVFDLEVTESNPGGFQLYDVYCDGAGSVVSSRLCFKTRDLAEYAVSQFFEEYKEYMIYNK